MKDAVAEDFVPLYKVGCPDEISLSRWRTHRKGFSHNTETYCS